MTAAAGNGAPAEPDELETPLFPEIRGGEKVRELLQTPWITRPTAPPRSAKTWPMLRE